ncbi:winged helix-turn-helix domain-containing protein [Bacteroides heparinolyticus]|uniref:winged helix-turn-helix domain-containing protein n=1 Tax=Prevotella heparinolytica TaxID=28113 RepID=UPI003990B15E
MLLHDAILEVLKRSGKPMTCSEIRDEIVKQKLYQKKDCSSLNSGQISARINHYPHLFNKDTSCSPMLISLS